MISRRRFPQISKLLYVSTLAFVVALGISLTSTTWASPYGFSKYNLFNYLEASYLNTTANYDDGGNTQNLPSGNQFKEIKLNLLSSYDFSDRWGVFSNISFKRNESLTSSLNRYSTNLTNIELGGDILAWDGFVDVIPEVSINIPTYGAPGADASVLMGDGTTTYGGRLNISKSFKDFSTLAYFGVRMRSSGYSTLLPWGASLHYELTHFFFDAGLNATANLNDDTYTNTPQNRNVNNALYDAGSLIYNAVNPSWTRLAVRAAYRFDSDFFISLGVEQTLMGIRTYQGTQFLVGLGLNQLLGAPHKRLRELKELTPANQLPDNKRFKEDTKQEEMFSPEDITIQRVRIKKKPITPSR